MQQVNLDGEWDFAFEPKGTPVDAPARPAQFDQKIVVPFGPHISTEATSSRQ